MINFQCEMFSKNPNSLHLRTEGINYRLLFNEYTDTLQTGQFKVRLPSYFSAKNKSSGGFEVQIYIICQVGLIGYFPDYCCDLSFSKV